MDNETDMVLKNGTMGFLYSLVAVKSCNCMVCSNISVDMHSHIQAAGQYQLGIAVNFGDTICDDLCLVHIKKFH